MVIVALHFCVFLAIVLLTTAYPIKLNIVLDWLLKRRPIERLTWPTVTRSVNFYRKIFVSFPVPISGLLNFCVSLENQFQHANFVLLRDKTNTWFPQAIKERSNSLYNLFPGVNSTVDFIRELNWILIFFFTVWPNKLTASCNYFIYGPCMHRSAKQN